LRLSGVLKLPKQQLSRSDSAIERSTLTPERPL
jgi:hypothetical protein